MYPAEHPASRLIFADILVRVSPNAPLPRAHLAQSEELVTALPESFHWSATEKLVIGISDVCLVHELATARANRVFRADERQDRRVLGFLSVLVQPAITIGALGHTSRLVHACDGLMRMARSSAM